MGSGGFVGWVRLIQDKRGFDLPDLDHVRRDDSIGLRLSLATWPPIELAALEQTNQEDL
ncbi:hypothetical protein Poly41_01500 [Novipirellula artificiosorum]|uniref:Uncharacterized protein n=1 Tax=Novipirellula artificiosorum TaxID=2528016 RepID=A0A5C6DYZ0_9BACT|nr:hypothetical protein Poly41_01500 [Novipirellula artificiosorum]